MFELPLQDKVGVTKCDSDGDEAPLIKGAGVPLETKEEKRVRLAREREDKRLKADAKKKAKADKKLQEAEEAKQRRIAAGESPAEIYEEQRIKKLTGEANEIRKKYSSVNLLAQIPLEGVANDTDGTGGWLDFKDTWRRNPNIMEIWVRLRKTIIRASSGSWVSRNRAELFHDVQVGRWPRQDDKVLDRLKVNKAALIKRVVEDKKLSAGTTKTWAQIKKEGGQEYVEAVMV